MYHILDLAFLDSKDTIAAFVVETSIGLVLIEAGPHSTFTTLEKALQNIGYQVDDIKHVLLSHIHFDHAGAAWAFANRGATIHVHPLGAKHLANPEKLYQSAAMIYGDQMERLWGIMQPIPESQIYTPSHGEQLRIGDTIFQAWHTPGHAVHHIAWQVGETLFTGDAAGVKIQDGAVMPPCPPPDINIESWLASIHLMKQLPVKELVLTHFGKINDVQTHFQQLEEELSAWANWMKPYYEQQEKHGIIIPLFQDFVAKRLKTNGVTESDVAKYEKANPAFMSVAGLMRYWHKRLSV
jgi:glyoxylase-like metal-dependent hydrolase (beta-lactamase superfamily II)